MQRKCAENDVEAAVFDRVEWGCQVMHEERALAFVPVNGQVNHLGAEVKARNGRTLFHQYFRVFTGAARGVEDVFAVHVREQAEGVGPVIVSVMWFVIDQGVVTFGHLFVGAQDFLFHGWSVVVNWSNVRQ